MLHKIGEVPLVVRSSSLLEDRIGHAFSGKYKSLFILNRGTIEKRLADLEDAISEVYASHLPPRSDRVPARARPARFPGADGHPHPGGGRPAHRRLLVPAFAGVAFSRCEMRWSPRIRRTDGMARLVLGLGTRAVDRTGDDWPVLVALEQPTFRALQQPEEVFRYSQHEVDVVDLRDGQFDSVTLQHLLARVGRTHPARTRSSRSTAIRQLVPIVGMLVQLEPDDLVVTFDGLLRSGFPASAETILDHPRGGARRAGRR